MKYAVSFLISILVGSVFCASCNNSYRFTQSKRNIMFKDTLFPYQEEFQDYVDQIQSLRPFKVEDEIVSPGMLETKEDMISFYEYIISKKAPMVKWSKIFIGEDKTGKIWFASAVMDNSERKNNLHLIVVKDNCKILYMGVSH